MPSLRPRRHVIKRLAIAAVGLAAAIMTAMLAAHGSPVRAQPVASIALPSPGGTVQLYPWCNNVSLTFENGTPSESVVQAVTPSETVQAMWRHNAALNKFEGFSPAAPQASDLLSVDLLDAVFLCVDADASLSMPTVSPGLFDAMSMPLTAGCNVLGLTFPDGTAPSEVADAVSPPGALNTI